MSETTVETPEVETAEVETEEIEETEETKPEFENPVLGLLWDQVMDKVTDYNDLRQKLQASRVKNQEIINFLEDSDDEKAVTYREKMAEFQEAIDALKGDTFQYVRDLLKVEDLTDEEKVSAEGNLKTLIGKIDNMVLTGQSLAVDEDAVFTQGMTLPKSVKTDRAEKKAARIGQGAGLEKMRLAGVIVDGLTFGTWTTAKEALGNSDLKVLHNAYYAAASKAKGAEVRSFKEAPNSVTYTFNGHTVTVLKDAKNQED